MSTFTDEQAQVAITITPFDDALVYCPFTTALTGDATTTGTTPVQYTLTATSDLPYATPKTTDPLTANDNRDPQDVTVSPYVNWSTSDTTIATISHDGLLTPVGTGSVTITAEYRGVTATKSVTCS